MFPPFFLIIRQAYGWGSNEYNKLGLGTESIIKKPTLIPSLSHIEQVVAGRHHSAFLTTTHEL